MVGTQLCTIAMEIVIKTTCQVGCQLLRSLTAAEPIVKTIVLRKINSRDHYHEHNQALTTCSNSWLRLKSSDS